MKFEYVVYIKKTGFSLCSYNLTIYLHSIYDLKFGVKTMQFCH